MLVALALDTRGQSHPDSRVGLLPLALLVNGNAVGVLCSVSGFLSAKVTL